MKNYIFQIYTFTDYYIFTMLSVLRNGLIHNRLPKLSYSGDFLAISDAIANTTSLEDLSIHIDRKDLEVLGETLHKHASIKSLSVHGKGWSLSHAKVDKHRIANFLDVLLNGSTLTTLKLDLMVYPEWHFEVLGKHLSSPECALKVLKLSNFEEYADYFHFHFFELAKGLLTNTSLTKLRIYSDQAYVTDEEIIAFTELFKVNRTITSFHFDIDRMIYDDDNTEKSAILFQEFTETLRSNPNITKLSLSGFGNLNDQDRELSFSENLRSLRLFKVIAKPNYNLDVHLQTYRNLANLIVRSQTLTSLTLHVSDIAVESVQMLADALSTNPGLTTLYLDFYSEHIHLIHHLVKGLLTNTNLTSLNLFDESQTLENNENVNLTMKIVARNRVLHSSLFIQLFNTVKSVKESDFDENGYFKTKRLIDHKCNSSKRQRV